MWITYGIITVILIIAELVYFRISDKCNIIDKPNERSSHTKVVIRGGGIIFVIGLWVWSAFFGFQYPWMLAAVTLAAGISFVDDIHSLPDSVRLVVQFVAMGLLFWQIVQSLGFAGGEFAWWVWALIGIAALIVCVGATNIYNFMDGINGITAGYSLAVLVPLLLANRSFASLRMTEGSWRSRFWWWPLSACWCSASSTFGRRTRRSALPGTLGAWGWRSSCCS